MPNVNPTYPPAGGVAGSATQGMDTTRYFAAAIAFDVASGAQAFLNISLPTTTGILHLTTAPPGAAISISTTTPITTGVMTANGLEYTTQITPSSPSPGQVTVQFTVVNTTLATVTGYWLLEANNAAAPASYVVNADSSECFIAQIVGDPAFPMPTPTASSPIKDSQPNALSGTASVFSQLVGAPPPGLPAVPTITATWTQVGSFNVSADLSGQIVTPGLNQVTVATPATCLAPVVKQSATLSFGLVATYGGTSFTVSNEWDVPVVVNPRSRQMILVFDRTGSMSSPVSSTPGDPSKFTVASQAAWVWADIWAAFRGPVTGLVAPDQDKVGVLAFDNSTGSWGTFDTSGLLLTVPMTDTATFAASLNVQPDVGFPRNSTPIGDALIRAMDSFDTAHASTTTEYVAILMTDGQENCGHVVLDPATAPASTAHWPTAAVDDASPPPVGKTGRSQVAKQLVVYTLGFGNMVEPSSLAALPSSVTNLFHGVGPVGLYGQVNSSNDLMSQLALFTSSAIGANAVGATALGDPAKTLQFDVNGREQLLAFVINTTSAATTLEVKVSQGGAFTSVTTPVATGVTVLTRATHTLVVVDLVHLAPTGLAFNQTLASTWQINSTLSGSPVDLTHTSLCLLDLYLNASFKLDKPIYRIGDPIHITCTLQAGGKPVRHALVRVASERPAEGLGTFLATNSKGYVPRPQPNRNKDRRGAGDPLAAKPAMFSTLLAAKKLDDLPITRGPAIFVDGSDQLKDDGTGTGVYTNTFVDTAKEGAHTWTFVATGNLPGAGRFSRTFRVSTWVGVKIDPASSPVTLTFGAPAPAGLLGAIVDVFPRSSNGELLGPFRSGDISFKVAGGTLGGPIESTFDGHYRQPIYYRQGDTPIVTVNGQGTPFPPVVVSTNPLCKLWHALPLLWRELLESVECCACGCKHPVHLSWSGAERVEATVTRSAAEALGRLGDLLKKHL